jgi:hypothetical protein
MDRRESDRGLFQKGPSTSSNIFNYSGPFVLEVSLDESVRWAGHVASMGVGERDTYKNLN